MTISPAIKTTVRQSNIELLRLVVMGMIVLHHFIFHGLGLYRNLAFGEASLMDANDTKMALIADSFLICGVNVFILISGWFSIKFKTKSFVKLFAICSFFAVVGWGIYLAVNDIPMGGGILLRFVKRAVFVISSKTWWFIQLYFLLMFLSTPINKYIENASRKSLIYTIGILLFINVYLGWIQGIEFVKDGYNLFNFIMLYMIGRYLRLYWNNDYSKYRDLLVFIAASIATAVLALLLNRMGRNTYMALSYNCPFIIIASISLLLLFTKFNFKSKAINYLASSSLAIYLFQEGCYNCYKYIGQMYTSGVPALKFALMIVFYFVLSMLAPIAIDKLRLLAFGKLEEKAADVLDKKVFQKYIE